MLYLVPTPIGNLEDMTFRAIAMLRAADLVLAEDTRKSGRLLKHYDVDTPMSSYHQHNEHQRTPGILKKLQGGQTIVLITSAGTPGISDPGYLLVEACHTHHIPVSALPGATAFVPALVNAGLPANRFCFEGFLPRKKGRRKRLEGLMQEERTMIFYESPYRIKKTLGQLRDTFGGERMASIGRELTKLHEETLRGTLDQLCTHFNDRVVKGEFVIIVSGKAT